MSTVHGVARDHCLAPERASAEIYGGRYRKLFVDLPPLDADDAALHALGRAGGPGDVGIEYADAEDGSVAAVWPFFGQFIAHDITADRSPIGHRADAEAVRNFRTPRANLEPLNRSQTGLTEHGWDRETPLWLYILKEAAELGDGLRLGPVGGRIVGEVLVGIIGADPESFLALDPSWTPSLPSHTPGSFGLADILAPAPE